MSTPAGTRTKAPTERGGGLRYRWAVLSMNFLVLGLNYADRAAIGVAAPVIMAEYGFSKSSWGWISAAFFLGYAPFCFIGGYTADRFGPRKVMAIAVGWWSLFTALTAAGFGFVSFLVIRFFFGFGEGPQATVTAKTMSNWFPQRQLGTAMGLSQASTPLGGAVGTPLVVALMNAFHGDWRAPFIILGVIGVLFVIGWWTVVRDRPEGFRRVRPAEIAEMAAEERAHPVDPGNGEGSRWRYLRNPVVLTTALAYFGYSWVLYAFLNWFPDFLSEAHGLDLNSIAFTGSIPWLCGFVGLAIGGVLTDALGRRFGVFGARKWTVVLGMLLVAIAFAGVGVVDSTTASVTLMAVVVFILYIVGAQFFALIAPVVPRASFGSVSGFVHFIANIAGIIGPVAIGYLGWGTAFGLSAAIAAVPVLALAVFGRGPRKVQTKNAAL